LRAGDNRQAVPTVHPQGLGQESLGARITRAGDHRGLAVETTLRRSCQPGSNGQYMAAGTSSIRTAPRVSPSGPIRRRRNVLGNTLVHRQLRVGRVVVSREPFRSNRAISTTRLGCAVSGCNLARENGKSPDRL
jgi:hypothetical protein